MKIIIARAIVIAKTTLQRHSTAGRFNTKENDRFYRLYNAFNETIEFFNNDKQAAKQWFINPVKGLG